MSFASRRRSPVPPALFVVCLAAATGACTPEKASAPADLSRTFPQYASSVLQRGAEIGRTARGFEVITTGHGKPAGSVILPATGSDPIVFSSRKGGEIRVRESVLRGEGRVQDRAVTYAVEGGASYWSAGANGAEEWFLFDAGAVAKNRPAAIWEVAGATPVKHGDAVAITLDSGRRIVTVTAPAAYLADGTKAKVTLAVRGQQIEMFVDTKGQAALVDPGWSFVAPMNHPRLGHRAVRLTDGTVLVAGGESNFFQPPGLVTGMGPPTNSSESYDENFDQWTDQGFLGWEREEHAMVTQPGQNPPDGTALVMGGIDSFGNVLSVAEIFDPPSGQWFFDSNMFDARAAHTATRLQNDLVLVAGGYGQCPALAKKGAPASAIGGAGSSIGSGFCYLCSSEVYDPNGGSAVAEAIGGASGVWNFASNLNDCRAYHTETLLPNGDVLIAGGEGDFGVLNSVEIWSPQTLQWNLAAPMLTNRERHTATLLDDGRVLVTGGTDLNGAPLTSAEIYDPATDTWTSVPDMSGPRTMHAASKMIDGTVLISGGRDLNGNAQITSTLFVPAQGQFVDQPDMNDYHAEHTSTALLSGNVLVAGGDNFQGDPPLSAACEVYASAGLPGQPCMSAADCGSGFCVDGVCCNTACDQPCEACTDIARGQPQVPQLKSGDGGDGLVGSGGGDGFCGPVFQGQDPTNDCADLDPTSCGTIGTCDGGGACELFSEGTICQTPGCQGNVSQGGGTCDGAGTCNPVGTTEDCSPYACVGGVCTKACVDSTECSTFAYCDGVVKTCQPKKPDGSTAFAAEQCLSGFAADGVCCDTACAGQCDVCSAALGAPKDGVCSPLSNVQCNDGDACTKVDVCNNGKCIGGQPVVCPGDTGCAGGLACDSKTGQCSVATPPKNAGDPCDDGKSCTSGEVCTVAGACMGATVACTPGQCQESGACVEGKGCQFVDKDNYTACSADSNPCTLDWCIDGTCIANSLADLSPCPGGTCIGGKCIPDGSNPNGGSGGGGGNGTGGNATGGNATGGDGGGATTGTGTSTGTGGSSGAGNGKDDEYKLLGAGCTVTTEPASTSSNGFFAGLGALLGLAGIARRRRDRR
ncbi:MAG: kelch repeat-containing protein [Polyangiaceae bacterium]